MNNTRQALRASALAALLSFIPSLAHAHTSTDGFLHDAAHVLFGAQHLLVIPVLVLGVAGVVFAAVRRTRSRAR